jgi:DNA-binding PadR family transcriptional regulator
LSIVNRVPRRLTPTSYALLGLLNLRPFSAYELTKYMKRSALGDLWPRTEASIYNEPKTLEELGLVTASTASTGARDRTVYSITAAGRKALRSWLREPGLRLSFECEAALKVFFGDATDLQTVRSHLQTLAAQPETAVPPPVDALRHLLDGELEFPERLHYTAIAADLIARINLTVAEWARDWLQRTDRWDGTSLDDAKHAQAVTVLRGLLTKVETRERRKNQRRAAAP